MTHDATTLAASHSPASHGLRAVLAVVAGDEPSVRTLAPGGALTLGRSSSCDWSFTDTQASRVQAIVRASFATSSFRREVVGAWLNFYVLSQTLPEARRLLAIYQARLQSNLVHSLRPIVGLRAEEVARALGAMIDGVYIREALKGTAPDGVSAAAMVMDCLERELRA